MLKVYRNIFVDLLLFIAFATICAISAIMTAMLTKFCAILIVFAGLGCIASIRQFWVDIRVIFRFKRRRAENQ